MPETGRIFYEAGLRELPLHPPTEVHFTNDERAPLLIVGAEKDHTVPASVSRAQYKKYEQSSAQTDYLEFEGRPHLIMAGEGWEEVAAAIDSWLDGVLETPARRRRPWTSGWAARSPSSPARARASGWRSCGRSPPRALTVVAGARSAGPLAGLDGVTAVAVDLAAPGGPEPLVARGGRAARPRRRARQQRRRRPAAARRASSPSATTTSRRRCSSTSSPRCARPAPRSRTCSRAASGAIVNVASVNAFFHPDGR